MIKSDLKKKYLEKVKKLSKYDEFYFEKNNPLISDGEYDDLKNEILDLEKKF